MAHSHANQSSRPQDMTDSDGDIDMTGSRDTDDISSPSLQLPKRGISGPRANGPASEKDADRPTFIIATDFGTTFSSVAFIRIPPSTHRSVLSVRDVQCIRNYPDIYADGTSTTALMTCDDVPTEIWYTQNEDEDAMISDISEDERSGSDASSRSLDLGSTSSESPTLTRTRSGRPLPKPPKPKHILWGYSVNAAVVDHSDVGSPAGHLTKFKLMLDKQTDNEEMKCLRRDLNKKLTGLVNAQVIKRREQVITDYLIQLLGHAKMELVDKHQLLPDSPVEFVLCVPNTWGGHACRIMHDAMAKAVQTVGLTAVKEDSIDNLFIVSEPEAAAQFVLADSGQEGGIEPDETLIIVDAGGGTVDVTTYSVNQRRPLRLREEAVKPGSALCGASFLNDRYRSLLFDRLQDQANDIATNGVTLEDIIDTKVIHWENREKRSTNITVDTWKPNKVWIHGLKKSRDRQSGIIRNYLVLTADQIRVVFEPSLLAVERLVRNQLQLAASKGLEVSKVILVGGFSASPSLESHMGQVLSRMWSLRGNPIELISHRRFKTSAVAQGAVLRALRKEHGPERYAVSSYGLLCTEQPNPEEYPQHKDAILTVDLVDGEEWVKDTIYWVIQADTKQATLQPYDPIPSRHTFPFGAERLICREALYVSDTPQKSHYQRAHSKNRGATRLVTITANMTFLKEQGLIPISKGPVDPRTRRPREYYSIDMDLVVIVEARNLRFEARWPRGSHEVRASAKISIAAGFPPGTA